MIVHNDLFFNERVRSRRPAPPLLLLLQPSSLTFFAGGGITFVHTGSLFGCAARHLPDRARTGLCKFRWWLRKFAGDDSYMSGNTLSRATTFVHVWVLCRRIQIPAPAPSVTREGTVDCLQAGAGQRPLLLAEPDGPSELTLVHACMHAQATLTGT